MQFNAYVTFNGQCEEAFKAYEKILGGKITAMMPHEGTPAADHVPSEWRKKIIHARLVVDNKVMMGFDAPPDHYKEPAGISMTIGVATPAEAERIFTALSQNGKVQMAMEKTFFSERFGMLIDRFGIPWMILCEPAA